MIISPEIGIPLYAGGYALILLGTAAASIYLKDEVEPDWIFGAAISGMFWPMILLVSPLGALLYALWYLLARLVPMLPGSARRRNND
jgi:hypothetical protein